MVAVSVSWSLNSAELVHPPTDDDSVLLVSVTGPSGSLQIAFFLNVVYLFPSMGFFVFSAEKMFGNKKGMTSIKVSQMTTSGIVH